MCDLMLVVEVITKSRNPAETVGSFADACLDGLSGLLFADD